MGRGNRDYKVAEAPLGQGFTRYRDGYAKAAWLFDGTTFWTFDDPAIMNEQARYVRKERLGGIMFWELSGDTPDGELIAAIADGLGELEPRPGNPLRGRARRAAPSPPARSARRGALISGGPRSGPFRGLRARDLLPQIPGMRRKSMRPARFELATSASAGQRSIP